MNTLQPLSITVAGKFILLGEHAAVYGEPAIGAPISRKLHLRAQPGRGKLETRPHLENRSSRATPEQFVRKALGSLADQLDLHLDFDFPPRSGFGSSAALAIALLRLRQICQNARALSSHALFDAALRLEKIAHAHPSGLDPAIIITGQPIVFQKRTARPNIRRIHLGDRFHWVVGHCGQHDGTAQAVNNLAEQRKRQPRLIRAAIRVLGEASASGARGLVEGNRHSVAQAMNLAQGVLAGLGLSSERMHACLTLAHHEGALGAKMSGAGGLGGAFVALLPDARAAQRLVRCLKETSIEAWIENWEQAPPG